MDNLILPPSTRFEKARRRNEEGQGKIVGLSPWRNYNTAQRKLEGVATKKASWRDYYDMYRQHSMVRAAIEKIAKTATNVGYEFQPRDTRSDEVASEVAELKAWFGKQVDFIGELRRIYKDLLIYGDAFLYVVYDRLKRPTKLKRLHPATIFIEPNKYGEVLAYYQLLDINDTPTRFDANEMIHFKLDDPDNDIYGLSPLESLKMAVAADLFAQRYNLSFFENSGVTGTIIGIRNANPEEVQRNRAWLEQNYTGPEAAHKPIVVEGESVSISKSVATHNEMGFLEGRNFIIKEILGVIDVPPAKVGIMETANRSNSREQDKTFRTESIDPLQYIVETAINDQFILKILKIKNTIFVHSEGDNRDAMEQMDYYTKGQAWSVYSPNEVRAKFGMGPIDGGEIHGIMTPTGFVPTDRLNLFFQLPQNNSADIPGVPQDPLEGEPISDENPQVSTAIGRDVAKSLNNHGLIFQAALMKLSLAKRDDVALRQAYSYVNDLRSTGDSRIEHACDSLHKACTSSDAILRVGYIERAQEALSTFIKPIEEHSSDESDESI